MKMPKWLKKIKDGVAQRPHFDPETNSIMRPEREQQKVESEKADPKKQARVRVLLRMLEVLS